MNSTINETWGTTNGTTEGALSPNLWAPDDLFTPNASLYNFTNSTTNLNSSDDGGTISYIWGSLLLLCMCLSSKSNTAESYRIAQLRRAQSDKRFNERRKRVVEASVITKRVIACDENKTLRLGDVSGSVSLDDSFSLNSLEDENLSECIICLEPFRKGDFVTWSKSMDCLHVFHQECLESWFENPKHGDCPACRSQIIVDDGQEKGANADDEMEQSSSGLAFVIMNGLISPLKRARDSVVGSSISVGDESGDATHQGAFGLRRVFSLDRSDSGIGRALHRVSSGLYSRLSETFESANEEEEGRDLSPTQTEIELRRTRSEGLPITPIIRNTAFLQNGRGISNGGPDHSLDLELDLERPAEVGHVAPRPRFMLIGKDSQGGAYSHVTTSLYFADGGDYISDDEDSIGPKTLWSAGSLGEVEDDLEAGMSEVSGRSC